MLVPVLGDMGKTCKTALSYRGFCNVLSAKGNGSLLYRLKPRKTVNKLRLTVSVNTGKADNLARADGKGNVFNGVVLVQLACNADVFNVKDNISGLFFLLVNGEINVPSDHHFRKLCL